MGAGIDEEVEVLCGVMDGVEAPEERDFVGPAVAPVEADLSDDDGGDDAEPERLGGYGRGEAGGDDVTYSEGQGGKRNADEDAGEKAGEEVVAEVGEDGLAEDGFGMEREEAFEWGEDDGEEDKPGAEADDLEDVGVESVE